MKFAEAFKNMKAGVPMKLPSWGGYWFWDSEKETIMMKCRKVDSETGKDLLDIRETRRVEYTLANILSDEWIPATEENTTILGGTPTFGFGDAIKYLKRGLKVKRQGWNGKNQHIELAKNISYVTPDGSVQNCDHDAIGNQAIAFVGTSGVQMGWLASQADMLAEDWIFAEQDDNMKKLNMNSIIKVKLTPFGADIFYHQYDELNEKIFNSGGKPIHPQMPQIDDKGFSKFQLHKFINLYGDYMTVGQKNVVEDISIYIDEDDLE